MQTSEFGLSSFTLEQAHELIYQGIWVDTFKVKISVCAAFYKCHPLETVVIPNYSWWNRDFKTKCVFLQKENP